MTIILLKYRVIAFPIRLLSRLRLNLARTLYMIGIFGLTALCIRVAIVCVAKMASGNRSQPAQSNMDGDLIDS